MKRFGRLAAVVVSVVYLAVPGYAAETKTMSVDCNIGETIGAALQQFARPGRALTVNITGTCTENVVVTVDDTTLQGVAAGGATVVGADSAQNTIQVESAARVVLDNLIVSGPRNGIVAANSASLTVRDVKARNNAQSGVVSATGSRVSVESSGLTNNGLVGFAVTDNAAGFVTDSTIQENGSSGVVVQRASSARVGQSVAAVNGPNMITGNGGSGVLVYESAQALVHGNTIMGNGGAGVNVEAATGTVTANRLESNNAYGIIVTNNAGARIGITDATTGAGNTILGNTLDGVNISNGSNANLFGNTIRDNGRDGLNISRAAGRLVGGNVITANADRGISISGGTLFQARGDFALPFTADTIQTNALEGLGVFQGSSAELQNAMIEDNGGRGVTLSNNGSLRILGSTISGNGGDGIGVFIGSSLVVNAPPVSVTGNGRSGINLFDGASADIQFASITGNGGSGVSASTASKLRLLGTTIATHPGDGVGAFDGVTVLLQCTFSPFPNCAPGSVNVISSNGTGVNVATGSTGVIQGASVTANGQGVRVDTNATLRLQTASTQITGNTFSGLNVSHHSVVNFNSPAVTISGNDGTTQVNCFGAPSVLIGDVSGVTPGGIAASCGTVFPLF